MNVVHFGFALLQVVANLKTVFGDWIKTPVQTSSQVFESLRGGN